VFFDHEGTKDTKKTLHRKFYPKSGNENERNGVSVNNNSINPHVARVGLLTALRAKRQIISTRNNERSEWFKHAEKAEKTGGQESLCSLPLRCRLFKPVSLRVRS
jgi:hypothetical protein